MNRTSSFLPLDGSIFIDFDFHLHKWETFMCVHEIIVSDIECIAISDTTETKMYYLFQVMKYLWKKYSTFREGLLKKKKYFFKEKTIWNAVLNEWHYSFNVGTRVRSYLHNIDRYIWNPLGFFILIGLLHSVGARDVLFFSIGNKSIRRCDASGLMERSG